MYPEYFPLWLKRLLFGFLSGISYAKWLVDSINLPLKETDWELYLDIHLASIIRLRRLPNLQNPRGFNDAVKWLMLFGQHRLMPMCVDKIAVREYVAREIGAEHLIPLKAYGPDWSDVLQAVKSGQGVLKCSHDSGSAFLFDQLPEHTLTQLESRFVRLLRREYGVGKGEWYYASVQPQLLVESRLPGSRPGSGPVDVKIHCVGGLPRLIHIIEGRQSSDPRQAFYLPDGERVYLKVKRDREAFEEAEVQTVLDIVIPLASILSKPFRYVRADFYLVEQRAFFGEMTFHEQSGLFADRAEELDLGRVLSIPCVNPSPSIHSQFPRFDFPDNFHGP
ncbi:hypothetical protein N9C74_02460 [Pontimonas sp.]|nr:hypothetical protein [Pontimonas sp.]